MTSTTESKNKKRMNPMVRALVLGCAALIATLPASAGVRIIGGFGYGMPWGGYGWSSYPYGAYSTTIVHPDAGQVKFDTKVKDAQVFTDGSYAGQVRDMKNFWLREGSYNIEVREAGPTAFAEQVYVTPGKTMHIDPALRIAPKS